MHRIDNLLLYNFWKNQGYKNDKRKRFEADHTVVLKHGCMGYYDFVNKAKYTTTICSIKDGIKFCGYSCSNGFTRNEVYFEKNSLICTQKGRREIKAVREFHDDHMILTISCNNVQAKKYYIAVRINKSFIDINFRCIHENNLI